MFQDGNWRKNIKTGIVDVGGGLRGIYAAGVFDWCLDNNIRFDLCIGVSAGSANVTAYVAEQRGRYYRFYAEYSFRKEYMGIGRFLRKRSFIDLDYVYGTLSNSDGESPLDYQKIMVSSSEVLILAPDDTCGMDTLTRNLEAMKQVYGKGIRSAGQIKEFLSK